MRNTLGFWLLGLSACGLVSGEVDPTFTDGRRDAVPGAAIVSLSDEKTAGIAVAGDDRIAVLLQSTEQDAAFRLAIHSKDGRLLHRTSVPIVPELSDCDVHDFIAAPDEKFYFSVHCSTGKQDRRIAWDNYVYRFGGKAELDRTFADQGRLSLGTRPLVAIGIAAQQDGKLVVAFQEGREWAGVVQRYLADGTPDQGFGTNGEVKTPVCPLRTGALALAADGKGGETVMVSGAVYRYERDEVGDLRAMGRVAVTRLTSNGDTDRSFGGQDGRPGVMVHELMTPEYALRLCPQASQLTVPLRDGSIMLVGRLWTEPFAMHVSSDGKFKSVRTFAPPKEILSESNVVLLPDGSHMVFLTAGDTTQSSTIFHLHQSSRAKDWVWDKQDGYSLEALKEKLPRLPGDAPLFAGRVAVQSDGRIVVGVQNYLVRFSGKP